MLSQTCLSFVSSKFYALESKVWTRRFSIINLGHELEVSHRTSAQTRADFEMLTLPTLVGLQPLQCSERTTYQNLVVEIIHRHRIFQ